MKKRHAAIEPNRYFRVFSMTCALVLLMISGAIGPSKLAVSARAQDGRMGDVSPTTVRSSTTGGKSYSFLAAGDIANCRQWIVSLFPIITVAAGATARLIDRLPTVPILAIGDLAYPSGTHAQYKNCYDKYWGRFKTRTFPVPGNHEYKTPKAAGYFAYWGTQAGPSRTGFYSFDHGNWHILALNSEIDGSESSDQGRWLKSDLENSSSRCALAYFHRPAFSAKRRKGNENAVELFNILYANRVSVVVNGHNHFYERTAPLDPGGRVDRERGIRTFIVGTGGQYLKKKVDAAAFTDVLITGNWGVLRLDLAKDHYHWRFISVGRSAPLDEGSGHCLDRFIQDQAESPGLSRRSKQ